MNPEAIRDCPLHERNNRPAYDRHNHDSRSIASQRSQFGYAESENAGEHNRVEEADENNAPHGEVAGADHRYGHQRSGTDCANTEQMAGLDFLQKTGPDKTAYHCTAPIEGNEARGGFLREAADIRLAEVVHQETSD